MGDDEVTGPQRIQLRRVRGWRKPEGAVVVSRPSRWGNPFRVVNDGSLLGEPLYRVEPPAGFDGVFLGGEHTRQVAHRQSVDLFRLHIGPMGFIEYDDETLHSLRVSLRGRDLACWCPPSVDCHADVLLEVANS